MVSGVISCVVCRPRPKCYPRCAILHRHMHQCRRTTRCRRQILLVRGLMGANKVSSCGVIGGALSRLRSGRQCASSKVQIRSDRPRCRRPHRFSPRRSISEVGLCARRCCGRCRGWRLRGGVAMFRPRTAPGLFYDGSGWVLARKNRVRSPREEVCGRNTYFGPFKARLFGLR